MVTKFCIFPITFSFSFPSFFFFSFFLCFIFVSFPLSYFDYFDWHETNFIYHSMRQKKSYFWLNNLCNLWYFLLIIHVVSRRWVNFVFCSFVGIINNQNHIFYHMSLAWRPCYFFFSDSELAWSQLPVRICHFQMTFRNFS